MLAYLKLKVKLNLWFNRLKSNGEEKDDSAKE